MRISSGELEEITGLRQHTAQARWFSTHFGVTVAIDQRGPIVTREAFEAMVARRYGLSGEIKPTRPQVRLSRVT